MTETAFSCRCGTVHGLLRNIRPASATHLVCYCSDCRAYARHLGDTAALDDAGGTELYQTSAADLELSAGQDRIACLRMSPRGPIRWYATCCNSALGNTAPSAGIPFAGFITARLADKAALGPIVARVFAQSATPPDGRRIQPFGVRTVFLRFLRTTIAARIRGDQRRHPFFPDGRPLAQPGRLTADQRRAAYR